MNLTLPRITHRLAAEREDLSLEIFASTYGADWDTADCLADTQLAELLSFAAGWDCAAAALGNPGAECPF